jgi:acetyl-CoA acetyltransferase
VPFPSDIAIAGIGITEQARRHERSTLSLCLEAARAALDDAGVSKEEIDGICARWPGPGGTVFHPGSADWAGLLGIPVRWIGDTYPQGIPATLDAVAAISAGLCTSVLVVGGQAGGLGRDGGRVADYTRPANEFVAPFGAFTTAQFALVAQVYLHRYRPDRERIAALAAAVRNNGHENPAAVMAGRGPYTAEDVLASPFVAEPLRLLELCLATEGAAALVITTLDRARSGQKMPVRILGGGEEWLRQQYVDPPRFDDVWSMGSDTARRMWAETGLRPADVDVAELYDINVFELVRQFEALGFCDAGEGADFAQERRLPLNTDGGLLSFSHIGFGGPQLKLVQAVRQLRGEAGAQQVHGAEIALTSGAGSGAQYYNALLLGRDR